MIKLINKMFANNGGSLYDEITTQKCTENITISMYAFRTEPYEGLQSFTTIHITFHLK